MSSNLIVNNIEVGAGATVYTAASNALTFGTNGSERLRITSDGSVGIGTNNPSYELHVRPPAATSSGQICAESNGTNTFAELVLKTDGGSANIWRNSSQKTDYGGANSLNIYQGASAGISFFTAGNNERLRITSAGNVVINSATSGEAKLDVHGGVAISSNSVTVSPSGYDLKIRSNTSKLGVHCDAANGTPILEFGTGGSTGCFITNLDNTPMRFGTQNTERMRIQGTGGVGLSTTLIRNQYFMNIAAPSQAYSGSTNLMDGGGICFQGTDNSFATGRTYPGIFWSGNTASLGRARAGIMGRSAANNDGTDIVFLTRYAADGTSMTPADERFRIRSGGQSYFGELAYTDTHNFKPDGQVNIISHKDVTSDKDDASKYHLVLKNPNNDTGESVGLGFAITDTASKIGAAIVHKRTSSGSTGELSFYVRHANGSAPTRRLHITPQGGVAIGSIDNGFANSLLVQAGVYISAYNGDNLITNASQGGGANTLYIGNQAIQMSSDKRIKKNIVDTTTNVLDKIKQVRVVDFDWDDPSDTASVNRNSRGKWTGCLAQEMVDIFPHIINAPRKEDNSLDYDSDRTWLVDYGHLVPTLIKGMQEQQKQIEELKAEVIALKSS